jgi:hypothetical protein
MIISRVVDYNTGYSVIFQSKLLFRVDNVLQEHTGLFRINKTPLKLN